MNISFLNEQVLSNKRRSFLTKRTVKTDELYIVAGWAGLTCASYRIWFPVGKISNNNNSLFNTMTTTVVESRLASQMQTVQWLIQKTPISYNNHNISRVLTVPTGFINGTLSESLWINRTGLKFPFLKWYLSYNYCKALQGPEKNLGPMLRWKFSLSFLLQLLVWLHTQSVFLILS